MFRARMKSQVIGVPLGHRCLDLFVHEAGYNLRWRRKDLGQSVRKFDVGKNIPAREAARERRWNAKDNSPDAGFAHGVGAQRARFGVCIDRAVFEADLVETT